MTEERIKEHADNAVRAMMRSYCFATGRAGEGKDEITQTIRIVAAEARNGGIEEALASFNLIAPGKDVPVDMIRDVISKRLKEKA